MKTKTLIYLLIAILLLSSCADTVNVQSCVNTTPNGFWFGLWHGFISPISFIISLLESDVSIYAVNNNGGWYDLGFVLGAGILTTGANKTAVKVK